MKQTKYSIEGGRNLRFVEWRIEMYEGRGMVAYGGEGHILDVDDERLHETPREAWLSEIQKNALNYQRALDRNADLNALFEHVMIMTGSVAEQ